MDAPDSLPGTSVGAKVLRGAIWLTAARLAVNLIGLASTLILARLLTPSDFGLVAIASGIMAIAGAVTSLSLGTVLVQVETLTKQDLDTAWTMSALRGASITLIQAALAIPLARFFGDERLVLVILGVSMTSLIAGLGSPATAVFTRNLQFWQEFILQSLTKACAFAAGVFVAWLTHSYWALVAGSIAGTLAGTLTSFALTRYRPSFDLSRWRSLFTFSIWLTLSDIVNTANYRADPLIIGWRLGPSDLGQYTVGGDLAALPTREATAPITNTLFPAFATMAANRDQLAAAVAKSQSLILGVALPVGLTFALLADRIVPFVLGDKWLPAVPIIQVLACLYGFTSISTPTQALAMAKRENRALFLRDIAMLVTRLPFVIGGMLAFGLMGAVWGRAISGILHVFINLDMIRRLGGASLARQVFGVWRSLVSGAVLTACVIAVTRTGLAAEFGPIGGIALLAAVAASSYTTMHILLWLLAGRPSGVEATILGIATDLIGPVGRRIRSV